MKSAENRAIRLLRKLLVVPGFDAPAVAKELVISEEDLTAFLAADRDMPLDRQLCLALLVIERVPGLKRNGYTLRGQVLAAMAVQRGDTPTHTAAPMSVRSMSQREPAPDSGDLS